MTPTMPPTTSVSPGVHQLLGRCRGPLLAIAVLVVTGLVLAAVRSGDRYGLLDPRSAKPHGSRATAELLAQRGVDTRVVTAAAEAGAMTGPDTTLLIVRPDLLSSRQQAELRHATVRSGGRTVLLSAGPGSVGTLAPGVEVHKPTEVAPHPPGCDLPAARRAGDADIGGFRYSTSAADADADSDGCYLSHCVPTLLRLPAGTGDTVLLGSPDLLYNERLAERGNASLAMQLLGSRQHLVWYLPSLDDSAAGEDTDRGFFDLIPAGWRWGALQLGLAAVLAALWRARRLGPLVRETLPAVVRASEATEGRARLYRRVNARDRAAGALRAAARARLAPLVGVAAAQAHHPDTLSRAVARHIDGDTAAAHSTLFGPAPGDDTALVRLADALDALERRITALQTDKDRTP